MNIHPLDTGRVRPTESEPPGFMSVKQVAAYLHLNEKKIYALVRERKIPATKITGKWVFPRVLVDRWLLESSHGGLLTDRLVITGSDDPLLHRLVLDMANRYEARALIGYSPTDTRLGLGLLAGMLADIGCVHWGPSEESALRHPALLHSYDAHHNWILVRAFRREQGLMVNPDTLARYPDVASLMTAPLRWALRQKGAGTLRYLQEAFAAHGMDEDGIRIGGIARSEHESASLVVCGEADIAAGVRGSAYEAGLAFVGLGWEAFDLAMSRGVYFRGLFQDLLELLRSAETKGLAQRLGGYDLSPAGELIWGMD